VASPTTLDRRAVVARAPRLVSGLLLCGTGIALMVHADLGLSPWDVLHQGLSRRTGISIGLVGILVGFVILVAWIPMRQRPGVGTVANVLLIGLTVDATLAVLPDVDGLPARVALLVLGTFLFGPGSGLYIGVGLGPGPRDGIMTALVARGHSVRMVRTLIEVTVLAAGWLLGGTVGLGTVLFAATVGPNVHFFLERCTLAHPEPPTVIGAE
jgi:uncharacterized membrane protein YczE